jgi:HEPN domain
VEKTHDLGLLLDRAMLIEPVFNTWRDAADRLTPLATLYRYPGLLDDPLLEEFEEALDDATTIVKQAVSFLETDLESETEDS